MPNDTTKDPKKDGTGFLLFPREWEGLHEAFPEFPAQLDSRNPLLPSSSALVYGATGGVIYNAIRSLRKLPVKHAVLSGIGLVTLPLTALSVAAHEIGRSSCKDDVKAILEADNIKLPRRKFIKKVSGETYDDFALMGGLLALSGVFIYRKAPNIPKFGVLAWLGAFTTGQVTGKELHARVMGHDDGIMKRMEKYHKDLVKGNSIYVDRTGKPPNPFLYGPTEAIGHAIHDTKPRSWPSVPAFAPGIPVAAPGADLPEGHPEIFMPEPVPEGSKPHMAYIDSNGKETVMAQRDFDWNPENKALGLEALQDHLEDLQKHRRQAVHSAQYLWELIARREAANYKPFGRDQDSQPMILEKKALELLSSIHKQHYSQITDLDWCIANTQKLILQFQSDGKWLPSKADATDLSEAREKLLNNIRTHKKNLEVQNSTLESTLAMTPIDSEDKDDIKRALADNLKATAKLLDDLESDTGSR